MGSILAIQCSQQHQQVLRIHADVQNINRVQEFMLFTTSTGSTNSCWCSQQHQQVLRIHVDVHNINRFQEFILMFTTTSTGSKNSCWCSQQHQQVPREHVWCLQPFQQAPRICALFSPIVVVLFKIIWRHQSICWSHLHKLGADSKMFNRRWDQGIGNLIPGTLYYGWKF